MKIKVAATQMSCDWEIENNIKKSIHLIEKAAAQGAHIVLLQELFQTNTSKKIISLHNYLDEKKRIKNED